MRACLDLMWPILCLLLAVPPAVIADAPRTGSYQTSFDQTTPLAGGIEIFKRMLHPLCLCPEGG